MATAYLGLTVDDFWDRCSPRIIVAMIDQWRKIENGRDQMRAYIEKGGDPDKIKTKEQAKKKAYELGHAMW
jgi:hypothetical protein